MLTSPVRMPSDATAFSRSGLRSGFTASDQSEMTLNQTQASEGSPVSEFLPTFAEQAPGSLPFSTSFDWQQQQQQQQQPAHPRHGHSLSMPIFTPSNDFGSFAAAETSSSMVYPNYSLDSWPNSGLTPASGKAPSSSSVKRASRRPSVGSPRMTSDESVPRGLETQTMLQQMARSHSSPQSTLDHPSSVPAYQSRPGSNPDWLHSVSHTTASAQGSPFTTHLPGSAPGSLNAAPPERPTRNSAAGRSPEVEAKSS